MTNERPRMPRRHWIRSVWNCAVSTAMKIVQPKRRKSLGHQILRIIILVNIVDWLWLCLVGKERYMLSLSHYHLCAKLLPRPNFPEILSRPSGWHWGQHWVYPTLQDMVDLGKGYRIDNGAFCAKRNTTTANNSSFVREADHQLFIMVLSQVSNFDQRKAIRETWGRVAVEKPNVKLAFFLGTSPSAKVNARVERESLLNRDIIQTVMLEGKVTIAFKEFSAMEWVWKQCPRTIHYVKTDDDLYLVVDRLLEFSMQHKDDINTIYGRKMHAFCYSPPRINVAVRGQTRRSRWYSGWGKSYPHWLSPEYIVQVYLYTKDVPGKLIKAAYEGPFWYNDGDQMMNGIVAERAGVARVDVPDFRMPYSDNVVAKWLMPRRWRRAKYSGTVVISHEFEVGAHLDGEKLSEVHDLMVS